MSYDPSKSSDSISDFAAIAASRGPASPPYETPPIYASRTNLDAAATSSSSDLRPRIASPDNFANEKLTSPDSPTDPGDLTSSYGFPADTKGKQPTNNLPSSARSDLSFGNTSAPSRPPNMPTNQAPRVAVTDPLADFRSRKLSKPEGLGAKSDFPPREVNRMPISSQFGARPTMTRRDSDMSSDGGQDYDDFDWSDEDDIEEAARFEEERAKQIRMGRLSLWKISKFLATTFLGNLIISCALIVPVIVIQFVYRTQNTTSERDADHKDFVADNIQAWFIWAAFNLHVEWWLHILVELFPRAFLFLLRGVWGRPSQSILSLAEYYNAIKGYIKPIFYAALSWGSWAIIFDAIYGLYDHSNSRGSRAAYLYRIYQVIEFFFFFTLTICVEKILIKYIAMSFHKSAYAERVANVTRSLEVFDHLRDHKPKQKQREGEHSHKGSTFGFGRSGQFKNSPTVSGAATPIAPIDFVSDNELNNSGASTPSKGKWFGKHSQKRPSPRHTSDTLPQGDMPVALDVTGAGQAPARGSGKSALIARAAKSGRAMRTTASQASTLARVAMNDPFGLLNNETIGVGADINSPSAAKKLARSIFVAFRGSHKRAYLIPSDFEVAYASPEEAKEAFSVFDRDNNGDISQSEIKNTVMQVYKERRFLSRSMQDVNHAVGQLDSIFLIVALVIIMFEALAIFNVDISKTLTTFYTLAIAFAFIFKESAANVFDSIIFLFVTHPFDTGDRISIAGKVFVVKKMSLLSSLFVNDLNQDVYIANSILAATSIVNMRRSGYMWECITAQFAFDTPLEKLDAVEADMIHWLQTEPERLFVPSTAIVPQSIDYMRSMECTIGMTHSDNWQDWGRRFYRKNAFFAAFSFYCKKHGIRYANSNQPIVYWQDDAAALPPSYDGDDKDLDTNAVLASGGYVNDDFSPSPPSSPRSVPSGSTVIPPAPKPKTYMNFTPPPDELDGSGLRMRKLKKSDKEVTVQGGDG